MAISGHLEPVIQEGGVLNKALEGETHSMFCHEFLQIHLHLLSKKKTKLVYLAPETIKMRSKFYIQKSFFSLKKKRKESMPSECSNRGDRRFLQYETPRPLIKGCCLNIKSTPYLIMINKRINSPMHPLLCKKK